MKKTIWIISGLILMILIIDCQSDIIIPSKSIRIRIVAHSNQPQDQRLKQIIKKDIYQNFIQKMKGNTYEETDFEIRQNLPQIKSILDQYDVSYQLVYGPNYFPRKMYKKVLYPEGQYQSLVITLGQGRGSNWWCVLFPPLCLLEVDREKLDEVQYKIWIQEKIKQYVH